jgi:hypothetical protein
VVEQQVLAKGRRALLNFGIGHVLHENAVKGSGGGGSGGLVPLIEKQTGVKTYVITNIIPLAGDPGGLAAKLAPYPRGTVIPAAGTWLGTFNAGDLLPAGKNFCGVPFGEFVDAGLYAGQPAELTVSWPNPAIFLDPAYWAELQRRDALGGNNVDLNSYRQEHPPAYPLYPAAC